MASGHVSPIFVEKVEKERSSRAHLESDRGRAA